MPQIPYGQIVADAEAIAAASKAAAKPIYKSKTFWFNILVASTHYIGFLPAKYAVPVATAVNVGLRVITSAAIK